MLDINGFEVRDLGVDVAPELFVEEAISYKPQVVGMSGLLTLAFESMEGTIKALETAGLRENLKIMIGGAPINEQVREYTGADAWGKDAVAAVALAKRWIGVLEMLTENWSELTSRKNFKNVSSAGWILPA